MIRAEWLLHYRSIRAARPKPDTGVFLRALKELYGCILEPQDEAFCFLVDRYKNKVSEIHLTKYTALKEKGKLAAKALLRDLVYCNNPFLALIPKSENAWGSYIPIPSSNSTND